MSLCFKGMKQTKCDSENLFGDQNSKDTLSVYFCLNSLGFKNVVDPGNDIGQVGQQWGCQHLGLNIRLF